MQGRKQSAFVSVGEDSVVELILPHSPATPEGQELEKNGEGIYSLVFKTTNLSQAQEFLRSKQLRPEPEEKESIILGPDQAFGMVVGFTQHCPTIEKIGSRCPRVAQPSTAGVHHRSSPGRFRGCHVNHESLTFWERS